MFIASCLYFFFLSVWKVSLSLTAYNSDKCAAFSLRITNRFKEIGCHAIRYELLSSHSNIFTLFISLLIYKKTPGKGKGTLAQTTEWYSLVIYCSCDAYLFVLFRKQQRKKIRLPTQNGNR